MKIAHVSDIHIHDETIMGADPIANFRACLGHLRARHGDVERVVITGDLTHHGRPESYAALRALLAESGLTGDQAPRLLLGNHDDRDVYFSAFPDAPRDPNGFAQWTEDTPAGRFIYLDTLEPGTHAGRLCRARLAWLERALEAAANDGRSAHLFMHHNPTPVHVANADLIGLEDGASSLRDLLSAFPGQVRHLYFGHCHFTLSGSIRGVPFSAPRPTSHPNWPDFSGDAHRVGFGGLAQSYNLCFIDADATVVHTIEFLGEVAATWVPTLEDGWIDEN